MTFGKKHRAFVQLSRGRRSRAGFLLRQRVERDRHIYGGRFTAHWIIDDEETESFDFIFPGLNKYDIWRACIGTAKNAFRAEINMISIRRAWDMLSPEERAREQLLQSGEPIHYAQFGGLTLHEYRQRLMLEIMANEAPEVYEYFDLDFSFRYGVGLYIIVDADRISYPLINQTIDRFLELGQKSWRGEQPVPRDRLPFTWR